MATYADFVKYAESHADRIRSTGDGRYIAFIGNFKLVESKYSRDDDCTVNVYDAEKKIGQPGFKIAQNIHLDSAINRYL